MKKKPDQTDRQAIALKYFSFYKKPGIADATNWFDQRPAPWTVRPAGPMMQLSGLSAERP
ncbi:hypothetical protein [Pseudomonas chlororaphis]|uniref:hypothetical protein n=1 Tax=Pseudomonas chlororaphis TaxID=587753 RepID=UPI000F5510B5|nr:hypothetical protein [Pseudomonas chlororaphis]AZD21491.1 hypothetical protein C4K24_2188 [Pseudomonas chlororaphis subsp. aurantiaca]AZD47629.1 hypothetical protein C4K20_2214 [Pseudomonas chlororaphis subsp. aurantiaca]AZD66065.1 hypothetical protein C4K17_2179 [Pseudomonas chlororaphis subsp. aurantiaca]QIT22159.1 hypothetical protein HCN09_10640 [Pseudomonas chlororaphis subsp. aurantiaca]WDH06313.1 hypothetical protein PUP57_11740 [Pseudomonas chlororaphis]